MFSPAQVSPSEKLRLKSFGTLFTLQFLGPNSECINSPDSESANRFSWGQWHWQSIPENLCKRKYYLFATARYQKDCIFYKRSEVCYTYFHTACLTTSNLREWACFLLDSFKSPLCFSKLSNAIGDPWQSIPSPLLPSPPLQQSRQFSAASTCSNAVSLLGKTGADASAHKQFPLVGLVTYERVIAELQRNRACFHLTSLHNQTGDDTIRQYGVQFRSV